MKSILVFVFVVLICVLNAALWGIPSGLVAAVLAMCVGIDPEAAGYTVGCIMAAFGFLGVALHALGIAQHGVAR